MNIHEHQAKELLNLNKVNVARGMPAFSVNEALTAAKKLGGPIWVVKAQIHAGGRGKAGGVKVVNSLDEVKNAAEEGSPGTLIFIDFKLFLPKTLIIFFLLSCTLIASLLFFKIFSV